MKGPEMSNSNEEAWGCAIAIIAAILLLVFVAGFKFGSGMGGRMLGQDEMRFEAVKAGAAEWVIDADQSMKFQWKSCK